MARGTSPGLAGSPSPLTPRSLGLAVGGAHGAQVHLDGRRVRSGDVRDLGSGQVQGEVEDQDVLLWLLRWATGFSGPAIARTWRRTAGLRSADSRRLPPPSAGLPGTGGRIHRAA
ncbi:hypothetical protein [Kitasatospora sp. NPDC098663]|uniref:hypothetical protein n=1 Tax=Kitasatospora sp. NPDC098663 TaxID=3364096 RepID=UPI003823B406